MERESVCWSNEFLIQSFDFSFIGGGDRSASVLGEWAVYL